MQFDFSKIAEKLAKLNWNLVLSCIGSSFVLATAVALASAFFLLPEMQKPKGKGRARAKSDLKIASLQTLNKKDLDVIYGRNLFNSDGELGDVAEEKGEEEKKVPADEVIKSELPLKLLGTIYAGDPLNGLALVENTQKRKTNSFMPGDSILRNVYLRKVLKEKIIIENEGQLEFVALEKEEIVRSRRQKKKSPKSSSGIAPIATEPPPNKFSEDGFERDGSDIRMTSAYRQRLLTVDFAKVLQDAKATPNIVDGELRGFRLDRIRQDSIYEKAGLQNNDIVEEVNGVSLTDTGQTIKLLQSLRNAQEIEIRVKRNGRVMYLTLNVSQ